MKKKKKTDQEVVKKAEIETNKNPVSHLQVHTVEPVVKPQNKRKIPKGEITNGTKKAGQKPVGKTNGGTIKEVEKKPEAGKEIPVPVPPRKRGFFAWFVDGGK